MFVVFVVVVAILHEPPNVEGVGERGCDVVTAVSEEEPVVATNGMGDEIVEVLGRFLMHQVTQIPRQGRHEGVANRGPQVLVDEAVGQEGDRDEGEGSEIADDALFLTAEVVENVEQDAQVGQVHDGLVAVLADLCRHVQELNVVRETQRGEGIEFAKSGENAHFFYSLIFFFFFRSMNSLGEHFFFIL